MIVEVVAARRGGQRSAGRVGPPAGAAERPKTRRGIGGSSETCRSGRTTRARSSPPGWPRSRALVAAPRLCPRRATAPTRTTKARQSPRKPMVRRWRLRCSRRPFARRSSVPCPCRRSAMCPQWPPRSASHRLTRCRRTSQRPRRPPRNQEFHPRNRDTPHNPRNREFHPPNRDTHLLNWETPRRCTNHHCSSLRPV